MKTDEKDETLDNKSEKTMHHTKKHHQSHIGGIFWGLLLILVGGLMLANNMGYVNVNFANIIVLWPLIIVAVGLSIMSAGNWIWRVISIVFVIASLIFVGLAATGNIPLSQKMVTYEKDITKTSNTVQQAEVTVNTGASTLNINSANQDSIVKAKLNSNIAELTDKSVINGTTQQINLSMDTKFKGKWWVGDSRSELNVDLARNLPINLIVDSGASDEKIDVSQAMLQKVTVKTGVSSTELKLGSRESIVDVNIESGVSSIVIKVPANSGVHLNLDGGLTSSSLSDLSKISEKVYESTGYGQSNQKINITANVGVSSFTIERY